MKQFLYYTFGCIIGGILGTCMLEKVIVHIIF